LAGTQDVAEELLYKRHLLAVVLTAAKKLQKKTPEMFEQVRLSP